MLLLLEYKFTACMESGDCRAEYCMYGITLFSDDHTKEKQPDTDGDVSSLGWEYSLNAAGPVFSLAVISALQLLCA